MSGPFNGLRKQSLVCGADTADPSGQYFPSFGNKMTEEFCVFIIDVGYFFSAELAYPFAPNAEPFWTWHSIEPFYFWRSKKIEVSIPPLYKLVDVSFSDSAFSAGAGDVGVFDFRCRAFLIFSERFSASSVRTDIKRRT
jgi:hypothetical protein